MFVYKQASESFAGLVRDTMALQSRTTLLGIDTFIFITNKMVMKIWKLRRPSIGNKHTDILIEISIRNRLMAKEHFVCLFTNNKQTTKHSPR